MRSIMLVVTMVLLGLGGCGSSKKEYGTERPLLLPGSARQTWAVAPVINLSGQRAVDPILQADIVYAQLQQVAGLNVIPVNRVVEMYVSLRLTEVQSEEQAALLCDLLGADGLVIATITAYDPFDPPKLGASLQLFQKPREYQRPVDVDPRELARRATPPPSESAPVSSGFLQAVGMFDAANGSTRAELMAYAHGRNDPAGPYRQRAYLVEMDRYCGFVYHVLTRDLLAKPGLKTYQADQ